MTESSPKLLTISLYVLIIYHSLTILTSLLSVVSSLGFLSNPEQNVGIAMIFILGLAEILFSTYVIWMTWTNLKHLKTQTGSFDSIPYYIAIALVLLSLPYLFASINWTGLAFSLCYLAFLIAIIFQDSKV
ncbi:hypothetical protein ACVR05_01640 [Streptococcus caprae]|uniref:Uncharacterized protein n=1 Tax=Streptococcus caprae TaxID=1640501 RepID=A0ABV8CWY6_9STRE